MNQENVQFTTKTSIRNPMLHALDEGGMSECLFSILTFVQVKVFESKCMNNEVTIEEYDKNLRQTTKMASGRKNHYNTIKLASVAHILKIVKYIQCVSRHFT